MLTEPIDGRGVGADVSAVDLQKHARGHDRLKMLPTRPAIRLAKVEFQRQRPRDDEPPVVEAGGHVTARKLVAKSRKRRVVERLAQFKVEGQKRTAIRHPRGKRSGQTLHGLGAAIRHQPQPSAK